MSPHTKPKGPPSHGSKAWRKGARGWEMPEPLTAKPEGACMEVCATSLDKVPVTEVASQKLPKLIPPGF